MLNLQSATFSQLKQYATDNNIVVEGDRRRKQSYVAAIEAHFAFLEAAYAAVPAAENIDAVNDAEGNIYVSNAQPAGDHADIPCVSATSSSFAPVLIFAIQIVAYALGTAVLLVAGAAWAIQKALSAIAMAIAFPPQIDSQFYQQTKELMAMA